MGKFNKNEKIHQKKKMRIFKKIEKIQPKLRIFKNNEVIHQKMRNLKKIIKN